MSIKKVIGHFVEVPQDKDKFSILCPFHGEKTPSFGIDEERNSYHCFGCGVKGNDVEFIIKYKNLQDKQLVKQNGESYVYTAVAKAYKIRNEILGISSDSSYTPPPTNTPPKQPVNTVTRVLDIQSKPLLAYLKSRGITAPHALEHVKEIHYHNNKHDKAFYAVGMINQSQGAVIRTKNFKSNIGKSDITIISLMPHPHKVKIFEGIFDFWSYLQMSDEISDYIVLNSTTNIDKIDLSKYEYTDLYLDNGVTGDIATLKILEQWGDKTKIVDKRKTYKKYDDVNNFLLKIEIDKQVPRFVIYKGKITLFYMGKNIRTFDNVAEVEKYVAEKKRNKANK